jgi:hypothetical protein
LNGWKKCGKRGKIGFLTRIVCKNRVFGGKKKAPL